MTLAELLPAIQQLSATEKLKLIRILAEDLDVVKDIAPLETFKTYELPTPYDSFGAGAVLMEALKQTKIVVNNVCNSSNELARESQ
ncbi:hypothetical protein C7Y66_20115 [Chroococcidiopsis sp. CCALA 051]|uniref:hypothetical protein n=1 Tax=Chroococcidiopsis sp. CCALA 051 TaxID=869949 RepID=UPI000D0DA3D8|nr:hypothetical protein [Chroococcidiopsis sp. CCALA 051]PSM47388.1 hypothetical protein C7Y66_20115 [Chroococcidiopsis sp. CCALA 051]